jgi:hypothetical protein
MRSIGPQGIALVTLAIATLVTRHARADFASDAADIVEQLIEDDVATQVVPNAATKFPATCDLLPATIGALQAKRYNGIPAVVRKELADDAGLIVVLAVEGGNFTQLPGLPNSAAIRQETIDILMKLDPSAAKPPPAFVNTTTCSFTTSAPKQAASTIVLQACATTQPSASLELACALGLAVRDGASDDASLVPGDLRKGLGAIASQAVLNAFPTVAVAPNQFGQVVQLIDQAEAGTPLPTTLPVGSAQVIQALANQIVLLSKAPSESLEQVGAAVVQFSAYSTAALSSVKPTPPPLAAELAAFTTLAGGAYAVIADIKAKNYGAATSDSFDALNAVVDANCDNSGDGPCSEFGKLVRAFLKATAVYAVDSLTSTLDSSASSDFRAAAVDLIEATGGAGIRRKTFGGKSGRNAGWGFPNFALRESLRPGFASPAVPGTNSSALLTYASVDWPNLRFKIYPARRAGNPLWVGGNISVIDAIGPLVELAARNSTLGSTENAATRNGAFALGFLVPRFEFEFGVPELTRNLVLGIGIAARLYRAEQSSPLNATGPVVATYCIVGQSANNGCNGASFDENNFEGSIFIKYVP